jgi:hypothetical protein
VAGATTTASLLVDSLLRYHPLDHRWSLISYSCFWKYFVIGYPTFIWAFGKVLAALLSIIVYEHRSFEATRYFGQLVSCLLQQASSPTIRSKSSRLAEWFLELPVLKSFAFPGRLRCAAVTPHSRPSDLISARLFTIDFHLDETLHCNLSASTVHSSYSSQPPSASRHKTLGMEHLDQQVSSHQHPPCST